MGSCSNRGETREEKITRFAKEVISERDISRTEWQSSKGAEIRGVMGIDKGNEFINDMKKYRR